MNRPTLDAVHPVLPSQNVAAAIEFYRKLGFQLAFQDSHEDPRYAGVVRDQVEIHLQWHAAEEWAAVERPMLRLKVSNVDGLFEELKTQGVYHANTALRNTAWNTREFAFYDGDKNGLTFYRDA